MRTKMKGRPYPPSWQMEEKQDLAGWRAVASMVGMWGYFVDMYAQSSFQIPSYR